VKIKLEVTLKRAREKKEGRKEGTRKKKQNAGFFFLWEFRMQYGPEARERERER